MTSSGDAQKRSVVDEAVVPPPPPRPGVRHVHVLGTLIVSDDELRQRVDRHFHWPMIVLALLILPLLGLDFLHYQRAQQSGSVRSEDWVFWSIQVGYAVIWLAFLVEFVVKITIAESRVEYVRRNWLDLVIILVPVLRPVRAAYLARTSKIFTLRGVGMKFARYLITFVIGLEATERLLHRVGLKADAARPDPREMTRHELVQEVKRLRRLADAWEVWYQAHQEHVREHGGEPYRRTRPTEESAASDEPVDLAMGGEELATK
ncbi:MAG: hypothetical protein ACYTGC_01460 [Planctomycetota bacterium]